MASKRAQRRKACERKRRYASHDEAVPHCWGRCIVYRCQHCGGYHVGHPPAAVRQRLGWGGTKAGDRYQSSSLPALG